jgi:hypothetical protein
MAAWQTKDPSETFLVDFDFSASLAAITTKTVTVEVESGVDASPSSLLSGDPTVSGLIVQQRVTTGVPGCRYRFKCVAGDGTNVFTLYSSMPVGYTQVQGQLVITDFTSYGEVRAALGVSDEEVKDEVIGLPMYGNHLAMEFSQVEDELDLTDDLESVHTTLAAVALGTRTKVQKRALASLSLFATYAVARHLGTSLAMMAPKSIGDGKALMARFSDSPYKSTLAQVEAQYEKARTALATALAALNSTSTTQVTTVFFGVASPASDPVTGS